MAVWDNGPKPLLGANQKWQSSLSVVPQNAENRREKVDRHFG
jgi:hypothetical protein